MFSRRVLFVVTALLGAGALATLPGCEWLQGSGAGSNQSPFISNLRISPSSVFCGDKFSLSFRYDDPQGDIATTRVKLQRSGDTVVREESPLWPENQSRSAGVVTFGNFSFACDTKGGIWSVSVQLEDDRGHTSNILSGQITLASAG